jgi:DNA polymerase I-like protein with 3'-5' exonuclease and polymerase domains
MQRPRGNDFSLVTEDEISLHQTKYVAPAPPDSVTFLVGGKSLDWFFPAYRSIEVWNGSLLLSDTGQRFVPVFHPAYLMRVSTLMATLGNTIHEGIRMHKPFVPRPGRVHSNAHTVFVDTETQGFDGPINLVGASSDAETVEHFDPVDRAQMLHLQSILDEAAIIVAHNAQFDLNKLRDYGLRLDPDKWFDSMLLWHFYQPDLPKSLADMCKFVMAAEMCYHKGLGREDATQWAWACREQWERRAGDFGGFSSPECFYNAIDVAAMGRCWNLLIADVQREGRWDYFVNAIMPAGRTFWEIEAGGMRIDTVALEEWKTVLKQRVSDLTVTLLAHPLVIEALAKRTEVSGDSLAALEAAHSTELERLNAPRREAEALRASLPTKERSSIKLPRIIRKSDYTKALQKLRKADPTAGILKFTKSKKTGLITSLTTAEKLWLVYEGLRLPKQYADRKLKYGRRRKTLSVNKQSMQAILDLWTVNESKKQVVIIMRDLQHWSHWLANFASLEVQPNGYIYPRIQIRTATLRAASGEDEDEKGGDSPTNAQNWPLDLRNIVLPDVGQVMIQWDYSNQEWLINLWESGDFEGYRRTLAGEDRHAKGAVALASWQGKHRTLEMYTKEAMAADPTLYEERRVAKTMNFGLAYGMGAAKFAMSYGIGKGKKKRDAEKEASEIITVLQSAYPILTKWQNEVLLPYARRYKYLQTKFGARRYFHRIGKDGSLINRAKAYITSTTGAGMMHYRITPLQKMCQSYGGRLVTSTHDSFLASVPPEKVNEVMKLGKELLEKPFEQMNGFWCSVSAKIGQNWNEV